MHQFLRDNRWFFIPLLTCLAVGFVALGSIPFGHEIFYFSQRRTSFGDLFFKSITRLGEVYPYLLAGLVFLFFSLRKMTVTSVMGIIVLTFSNLLKNLFSQPRPKAYFESRQLLDQLTFVDNLYVNQGMTSFPSGHAMGAFALFGLLAFYYPRRPSQSLLLLLLAVSVSISRIYLVQHFLRDVLAGALLGVALAVMAWWVEARLARRGWGNSGLLNRARAKPTQV
jgi:membrane-associated phospholipid phosphatase